MAELEKIEREIRTLSAHLTYSEAQSRPVSPKERNRLEFLEEEKIRLTAPNFKKLLAAD